MAVLVVALMVTPLLLTVLNVLRPHRPKLATKGSESPSAADA